MSGATAEEGGGGVGVGGAGMDLLIEAGAVLATSLDVPTTMSQVARLTVGRVADMCVIDLLDDGGDIREVAVAAADERLGRELEDLRGRFPVDPAGRHPVAEVLRTGRPVLLPDMSSSLLESIAQGDEHARFMIEHNYRSAIVAPLLARGRTLGALSALRLGDGHSYAEEDLELVGELARRSALALDNARLFSELHAVEQRLQAILANLAEAITMEDEEGRIVFANHAAAELVRMESPEALMEAQPSVLRERFLLLDEEGRELSLREMPGRRLFAGEQPGPLLVHNIVRATGEERWHVVRSSPVIEPGTARILYVVNVFENITEVKRAELAEAFMAEASRVLVSSNDPIATLQRVARVAVPSVADWCAVHLLSEDEELERVAMHHRDPDKLELAERLEDERPPTLEDRGGIAEVVRTARAQIFSEVQPPGLSEAEAAEHGLGPLRAIGARSVIMVPLLGAMKTAVGAITLASIESARRLTPADLGLAVRLGRRSGTAVERARIYTERARIAHILQRALLPESLPRVVDAEVHALYAAAGELNEVGGDFYDVFHYDERCLMLLVGDVCGKGPRSAGVTALARHTLRAAALSGQRAPEMLATLHLALQRQPPGADLCTVCLVTMDDRKRPARLTVALAGHHPPLLIDSEGASRTVGEPGTLLGVIDPISIVETHVKLERGETLLMYTDGVIEAGRPAQELGERGLRELAARAPQLKLPEFLAEIERAAVERAAGSLRDDIALLALRLT